MHISLNFSFKKTTINILLAINQNFLHFYYRSEVLTNGINLVERKKTT